MQHPDRELTHRTNSFLCVLVCRETALKGWQYGSPQASTVILVDFNYFEEFHTFWKMLPNFKTL